jgi:phosphopantothenoylcysteine decarboxylase/phosphopantothenate--cysteine ligase
MHPAEDIRGIKSKKLSEKRIILGITGSIAAIDSVKLARELIRHGAFVFPVMSKAATRIIHPDSMEYSTAVRPIVELTGKTEHVLHCGMTENKADLLIISPCTANTISKIAHGIDDTAVTTFATTAIGSNVPIIIVPAMHLSMYNNRVVKENIKKLKKIGIKFIDPLITGNVAKIPTYADITEIVLRTIGPQDLKSIKLLVIGGATSEDIDDVRSITNRSSGKTAIAIANNAFERGADIELWYGCSAEQVPNYIPVKKFCNIQDLFNLVDKNELEFDIIIICAAISDYLPLKHKGKISSNKEKLTIELYPTKKVIKNIKSKFPKTKIIGFKLEEKKNELRQKTYSLLKENDLDFVVGNTIYALGKDESEVCIVDKKGKVNQKKGNKEQIASYILDVINMD